MKTLLILSLIFTSPLFAQSSIEIEEAVDNIRVEGKIQAAEAMWHKELEADVEKKQQKALALITQVGDIANARFSINDDMLKQNAQDAHLDFVSRLQGIYSDRQAFARKEIIPDSATLQNYSKRLDSLITDIEAFLK